MSAKKNVFICLLFFIFLFIPTISFAQEDPQKEILETKVLEINKPIYSFSISGNLTLNQENSYWRVVLIDKNKREYLVYEAYPLTVNSKSSSFANTCEETCVLEGIIPESLRIEGYAANYEITRTSFTDNYQQLSPQIKSLGIPKARQNFKQEKESSRITKLNQQIKAKGMKWVAGETSVSKLTYEQKKKLFSKPDGTPVDKLPNLQGFEYYKGGIFEIKPENESVLTAQTATESANLPESWDWRNVHGENWLTSIKDQGQYGTCMIFSTVAALESLINLYKNEHINYDLSEQNLIDCCGQPLQCLHMTACCLSQEKIFEEFCDPYVGEKQSTCMTQCNNSVKYQFSDIAHYIWPLDVYTGYINRSDPYETPIREKMLYPSFENIKKETILKGPLIYGMASIHHSVLLTGYETDGENLIIIYKNSWGESWGENGYGKELLKPENLLYFEGGPLFTSLKGISPFNNSEIKCVDKDNDGYCNWGISENKPDTCPASCKPEKDCDDSKPYLGPFDANFNCVLINVTPSPVPSCPNGELGNINCDPQELINELDLTILLKKWMPVRQPISPPDPGQKTADLDGDSDVDIDDLLILLSNWKATAK